MGEKSIRLRKSVVRLFRKVVEPWRGSAHPMELQRAILVDAGRDVVGIGQGRKVYPYTHLRIWLLTETSQERAILEASFEHGLDLPAAIRQYLEEQGCSVPDLEVEVASPTKGGRASASSASI